VSTSAFKYNVVVC